MYFFFRPVATPSFALLTQEMIIYVLVLSYYENMECCNLLSDPNILCVHGLVTE